ncbi:AsmA family protein [Halomonas maura]|uniref:AsmA family protein n=1 Tax=Halomonas maura TaxID=117606 RepID=UPI0025B306B9|nr:AsmA family protein [Halomonas maura]MDN3554624.1 AsmA family protein [Halomonas maura]
MKRILRTLLAAIGVLGLVVVGAVVFVTTFFDPEDLKPRLVEVVREHSGLELDLDGPLAWSFYPRLGVSVESAQARLASQAADDTPFAAFDHAAVSLAMAPLLRGEIAIDGLTLDGLALNLERDAEGRGNWETLIERLEERGEEAEAVLAPASAGPSPEDAGGLAVALNIASVQIRDGQVNYRDAQAGRELAVEQVDISGSNVNPDTPFPVTASLQVAVENGAESQGEGDAGMVSQVDLETKVNLGLAEGRHVLSELILDTSTHLAGGDEEDAQEARLHAKNLVLDLAAGQFKSSGSNLELNLLHPRLGEKRLPLTLAFQLDADLQQDTVRLREMELTGPDGLEASGNLAINELRQAPRYEGQLRLASLSLRPWLVRFQAMPTTASNQALSEVALASSVEGDLESLALDDLTLSLDGGTFNGHLAGRFDGSRLEADLKGDSLNLDDYLPPPDGSPKTASQGAIIQSAVAEEQSGGLVPAEWLGELDLDAHLVLGQLTLMEQTFENVELTLQGSEGRHRLTAFESDFHDGHLAASGQLDVRETPLRWRLAPRVENVRLGSLLDSLSSEPAPLGGRLQGEGELESQGNSMAEIKRALGGRLATRVAEGRIAGVNVSEELCTAAARLEGETPSREWRDDTEFERAEASFRIRDGVAESDDLLVTIPGVALDGEGQLDLTSEQFDLKAAARFTDSVDAACEVNPRIVDVPFPVRCEGQLGGDSGEWCRFDREAFQDTLAGLLRREVSERADEEVEERLDDAVKKLDERLGEGAGSELRKTFEGLFE